MAGRPTHATCARAREGGNLVEDIAGLLALEGRMARQQLKDEHADAPPVRGLCAASPHQHLRWDILLGSALGVRALLAHLFGHPHVSQLDEAWLHAGRGGAGATYAWSKQHRDSCMSWLGRGWGRAFVVEEDVFRFDVAIDVAMAVHMADGER